MRAWSHAVAGAAAHVSGRPSLWVAGGLAWVLTTGWLALLIGVARPPTLAELTFFGAGLFTSGAWPWNLVAIISAALAVVVGAAALVAMADAFLLRPNGAWPRNVGRILLVTFACALPAALALVALGLGIAAVAPAEFNSPRDGSGTLLRVAVRVAPFIIAFVLAVAAGAAVRAAATRRLVRGSSVRVALRAAPEDLAGAGWVALGQAAFLTAAWVAGLVAAALMLRVLWAPIGVRLGDGGFDPAAAFLLVGFVAIWLCLVLGGGALHALGSVSWTRVLGAAASEATPEPTGLETPERS
ncbi:MAG TPA: hypothetical protein VI277_05575 [Candidatus Limnocylindria bacterium]